MDYSRPEIASFGILELGIRIDKRPAASSPVFKTLSPKWSPLGDKIK